MIFTSISCTCEENVEVQPGDCIVLLTGFGMRETWEGKGGCCVPAGQE